ncbi:transposase [Microbispora sp. RL4-1S]|uniref:Transposase n=1 Tax=Microbispora oryzae TaxID=2806554 RepID=A0A941AFV2_9ACTN|nr:transposase [Microbispora oryzae]
MPRERRYPSDLTDAQWALVEPLLPAPNTGGRPEKHARRDIVDAILYVARTGCAWWQLPFHFPPWQTMYWYFVRWEEAEVTEQMLTALRRRLRVARGRAGKPWGSPAPRALRAPTAVCHRPSRRISRSQTPTQGTTGAHGKARKAAASAVRMRQHLRRPVIVRYRGSRGIPRAAATSWASPRIDVSEGGGELLQRAVSTVARSWRRTPGAGDTGILPSRSCPILPDLVHRLLCRSPRGVRSVRFGERTRR